MATGRIADTELPPLDQLFGQDLDFEVRVGATPVLSSTRTPRFALVFHDPALLARLRVAPDLFRLADAFVAGEVDIEGDLLAAMSVVDRIAGHEQLVELPATEHTQAEDARAVRYHYDVGNELYELFLDPRMIYSCAYFDRSDATLRAAQEKKLDIICRKLALQPGELLLDVGCGWGGLVGWAAQHHGVLAHGITLSVPQARYAAASTRAAGLARQVDIRVCDYRALPADARYDKIVSVGMAEHVGPAGLPDYFAILYARLAEDGLLLHHAITDPDPSSYSGATRWFRTRIFPSSELDTISHTLTAAEAAGFRVLHCASWSPHYSATLRRWLQNLRANEARAIELAGRATYRAYLLYFAGCAAAFDAGRVAVHQTLLAKKGRAAPSLPVGAELGF